MCASPTPGGVFAAVAINGFALGAHWCVRFFVFNRLVLFSTARSSTSARTTNQPTDRSRDSSLRPIFDQSQEFPSERVRGDIRPDAPRRGVRRFIPLADDRVVRAQHRRVRARVRRRGGARRRRRRRRVPRRRVFPRRDDDVRRVLRRVVGADVAAVRPNGARVRARARGGKARGVARRVAVF